MTNTTPRVTKGQQVFIRPEWQDPGDADYIWLAYTDEENGRVTIQPQIPDLAILPLTVVTVEMLSL